MGGGANLEMNHVLGNWIAENSVGFAQRGVEASGFDLLLVLWMMISRRKQQVPKVVY